MMSNQAEAPAAAGSGRYYCAVALGADIILQELLQERTEATHVVQDELGPAFEAAFQKGSDELGPAFELAFRKGSLRAVKLLLEHGAATTSSGTERMANLIRVAAATADGLEPIKLLLQHCVSDSKEASQERSALLDSGDSHDRTPLIIATTHGHRASITYLILAGVDLDRQDSEGRTAFHISVRDGWNPIATELLNAGADCSLPDNDGNFPISFVDTQEGSETRAAIVQALQSSNRLPYLLQKAAQRGDSKLVSTLLPCMIAINKPDEQGQTALYTAIVHRHDAIVDLLLEAGPKLNVVDSSDCSLLWHAANNEYDFLVERILDSGVGSDVIDYQLTEVTGMPKQRRTALIVSAGRGRQTIVSRLLDRNANPYIADADGWMALPLAVLEGHYETVEALVCAGVAIELRAPDGRTLLQIATENGDSKIAQLLEDAEANRTDNLKGIADREGDSPLHSAVRRQDIRMVNGLLAAKANPALPNRLGRCAFSLAVENDSLEILEILITHMALRDDGSEALGTALVNAASINFSDGVRTIIDTWMAEWLKSEDAIAKVQEAFVIACGHFPVHNAKFFLEKGAVAGKPDSSGRTGLFHAAQEGQLFKFAFLLDEECRVDQTGPDAQTLLYAAAENGHYESVRLLLGRGADVERASSDGRTPLFVAAEKGHCEIVKALLESGANLYHSISDGSIPISVAAQNGHRAVVRVLFEAGAKKQHERKPLATPLLGGQLVVADVLRDEMAKTPRVITQIPGPDDSLDSPPLPPRANSGQFPGNLAENLALDKLASTMTSGLKASARKISSTLSPTLVSKRIWGRTSHRESFYRTLSSKDRDNDEE
jgi:ankyrin repeat protein